MPSAVASSRPIEPLKLALDGCDAVISGAGAGPSASAGLTCSGERFEENFSDFIEKIRHPGYVLREFYPFKTPEETCAWWNRQILFNRYEKAPESVYDGLLVLVRNRDYFVLNTNVDHQFRIVGFNKKRLFYTQGDYGLWQCSKPCHQQTFDNKSRSSATWRRAARVVRAQ